MSSKEAETARRIRAQGLANGESFDTIAKTIYEHCTERFGTSRIKAQRLAQGVTLADMVERVKAMSVRDQKPEPRLGETLLCAYESGGKRPGPEYLHYLCASYGVDPIDLGYPVSCLCGSGHRGSAIGHAVVDGKTAEPADVEDHSEQEDERELRATARRLAVRSEPPRAGGIYATVQHVAHRMDELLATTTVAHGAVERWEADAAEHARQYQVVPPLRQLCDVAVDIGQLRRACTRRNPSAIQHRLHGLIARLAGLAGVILIDMGEAALARSFFRTSGIAAREAEDGALLAWVLVREALVPFYCGHLDQARRLAEHGRRLAGDTPCAARAMAPVIQARVLARARSCPGRQDLRQVSDELGRAAELIEAMPDSERADTAFGYTERQLAFHSGAAFADLGSYDEAEPRLAEALDRYPEGELVDRSLIRLTLADCRLHRGAPEEAVRIGQETMFALPVEHRSDIVLRRVHALLSAITADHSTLPGVQKLQQALASSGDFWAA